MPKTTYQSAYRNRPAEGGACLVEYVLLLSLVALVALPAVTSFGTSVEKMFRDIAGGGSFSTMGDDDRDDNNFIGTVPVR